MEAKNAYAAEMWKELLNAEAIPVVIVPASGWSRAAEMETYEVYIPWGKMHVAQEVLRKI